MYLNDFFPTQIDRVFYLPQTFFTRFEEFLKRTCRVTDSFNVSFSRKNSELFPYPRFSIFHFQVQLLKVFVSESLFHRDVLHFFYSIPSSRLSRTSLIQVCLFPAVQLFPRPRVDRFPAMDLSKYLESYPELRKKIFHNSHAFELVSRETSRPSSSRRFDGVWGILTNKIT